ncbi:TetR family transcriptional regulator [Streptomyces sp. S.PB5]|uniref:TetR/AcrR family transcriptional regulator n=1 Tax=Streptomyces sp. S.PB5 TaxID=3020844 RepID=UPI0025B06095|nr:TetR family transcriptional regulator [Streptomyces sp. S.PB5]MDN3023218.1 TetR family transcriptional regulator [Streptomyces sp. S.PB5]
MAIARAAAGLFVKHGLRATRAEDIAQAAGIAPRTFYRYFATKEEAVAPLYAAGAERWVEAVRHAPAELSVREALEHAVRRTLTPGAGVSAASWEWVRTLIRLAESSPALRKVWAEVCLGTERTLAGVLGERVARTRVEADVSPSGGGELGEREELEEPGALGELGELGEPGERGRQETDNVAPLSPELRFAAAVASAAVRTAVEAWVAGDARATEETGPASLALRNLGATDAYPWEKAG